MGFHKPSQAASISLRFSRNWLKIVFAGFPITCVLRGLMSDYRCATDLEVIEMSICFIRLSVKRLCALVCASTLALGLGLASPVAAQQVTLDREQALLALDHADPLRRL